MSTQEAYRILNLNPSKNLTKEEVEVWLEKARCRELNIFDDKNEIKSEEYKIVNFVSNDEYELEW